MTTDKSGIAEALDQYAKDRLERDMAAIYGDFGDVHDPIREAKEQGMTEMLYDDLCAVRDAGLPITNYYVRLKTRNGKLTACLGTKVSRYVTIDGEYVPVEELE